MYRVSCFVIIILVVSLLSNAQTPERITGAESASNQKPIAAGHRLSGTVTMLPDNKPVAKAGISIMSLPPAAGMKPLSLRTITDEQGRWKIDNVPDADYSVIIVPRRTILPTGAKDGQTSEVDSIFITKESRVKVAGADVDNLDFHVNKGGRISGKVIMDDGGLLPARLIVVPRAAIASNNAPMQNIQVNPDGSFSLKGVPNGEIFLRAYVFNMPNEYFMKSATVGAIDLLREPLRIEDGTEVKDVQIVFAKTKNN